MANRNARRLVLNDMKIVLLATLLLAQAASPPQFEVASVKANRVGGRTTRRVEQRGLTYLNITLGEFIQMAFGVKRYQVAGEDWITNTGSPNRYDIVAKASAATPESALREMLVPLLIERFHLTVHHESRVVPMYSLILARGGTKLKEGDGGQQYVYPAPRGGYRFQNYPMAEFVNMLSLMRSVGRPVIDRTSLAGRYTFTANLQDLPAGASSDDLKKAVVENDNAVFTALEEQLGLKLVPGREPIDVLVVDHADRTPTDD